jgi:nitrate reductase gamma subunit
VAAVLVIAGVVVLAGRRLFVPRVRATTSSIDYVALILLLAIIITGILPTLFVNLFGSGYDYRTTVGPWFRGLFTGDPHVNEIAHAPVIYQVHAASAWLIWVVWPFSRLVHAWSYPLWYLWRPYVVYRSRRATPPAEPGTGGRKWRRISVPY